MMATFWYRNDAPMPLIYPPQYTAVVVAEERSDRNVDVSYYSNSLVNEERDIAAESGWHSGCAYREQPVFPGESREP